MNMHANKTEADLDARRNDFVPNYLLYLLASASDGLSGEFHAHVETMGLRVPEWRVLACLSDRDGQMITQLAALALMEQSRLTKIIDQMVIKKLVTRRNDPRDRRRVPVFLTAAGRKLAAELVEAARVHESAVLQPLRKDEIEMLKQVLKRLIALHGRSQQTAQASS